MLKGLLAACICIFIGQSVFAAEHALALEDAGAHLSGTPFAVLNLGGSWLDSSLKTGTNSNELHIKYKSGILFGAALGYHTGPMRYFIEYANIYHNHDKFKLDDISVEPTGSTRLQAFLGGFHFLFSHYLDFVQPYMGAAIGAGKIESSGTDTVITTRLSNSTSDTKFTWYGAMGLNVNIEPRWDLLIEYRHIATNKAEHSIGDHFDSDNALIGFNYNF